MIQGRAAHPADPDDDCVVYHGKLLGIQKIAKFQFFFDPTAEIATLISDSSRLMLDVLALTEVMST